MNSRALNCVRSTGRAGELRSMDSTAYGQGARLGPRWPKMWAALPDELGDPPGLEANGKGEILVPMLCLSNSAIQTAPFLAVPPPSKSSTMKTLPVSLGCTDCTPVGSDFAAGD